MKKASYIDVILNMFTLAILISFDLDFIKSNSPYSSLLIGFGSACVFITALRLTVLTIKYINEQ